MQYIYNTEEELQGYIPGMIANPKNCTAPSMDIYDVLSFGVVTCAT